jgi:hypothetical protein
MVRTVLKYDPKIFRDLYEKIWRKKEVYYEKKLQSTIHFGLWWMGGALVLGLLTYLHSAFLPFCALSLLIGIVMGVQYYHQRRLFAQKTRNFYADVEDQIKRLNTYEEFVLEFDDQAITLWMDEEEYRTPWYVYDYLIDNEDYLYLSSVDPKRRNQNTLIPTETVPPEIFHQLKLLAGSKIENRIEG